ncbi:MAG: hypothetical protein JXR49_13100 [Acidobacteria bacterium]|nr:hypothetical protein [Acidobacteriota bacterium]
MPQLAAWPLEIVRQELESAGIYLLRDYKDGQTLWGNRPLSDPYPGRSCVAGEYNQGKYDIFTIRNILRRVGLEDKTPEVEKNLFQRINEGIEIKEPPQDSPTSVN